MQNVIKHSAVCRFISMIAAWFGGQWKKSSIVKRMTTAGSGERVSDGSLFTRLWLKAHRSYASAFERLRLTKLLDGSIFAKPYIWCFLTAVLAPILPTKFVIVLAAASAISVFLAYGCDRERRMPYAPANKFVFLYAAIYLAATVASVSFRGSMYVGALTILFILFAIMLQSAVQTRKQLDVLLYALITAGALVALYGVYQYVFGKTGGETWVDSDMFSDISARVYSTLQNPNVLSEYLLLVIPLCFAMVISPGGGLKRLFFIGCLAVTCLCLVLTFSRGGWLGLVFGMAVFLIMLDRRFILAGVVGIIALYFLLPETIVSRFTSIGNLSDSSTSYRVYIWMGTIAMLRDYWLSGVGPGQAAFNKVYPYYSYNAIIAPHSHNLFLQIMCDTGICGFAVFILLLLAFFRQLCSALKREKDKTSRYLQMGMIASMCGFLVQSVTDYSFYNYRVMLMFWVFIAVGAPVSRRTEMKEGGLW